LLGGEVLSEFMEMRVYEGYSVYEAKRFRRIFCYTERGADW
jgi:hypothetical protein